MAHTVQMISLTVAAMLLIAVAVSNARFLASEESNGSGGSSEGNFGGRDKDLDDSAHSVERRAFRRWRLPLPSFIMDPSIHNFQMANSFFHARQRRRSTAGFDAFQNSNDWTEQTQIDAIPRPRYSVHFRIYFNICVEI